MLNSTKLHTVKQTQRLFHYINCVRDANASRDSSVSIVSILLAGQSRDLRYQARTGGFSVVRTSQIGTGAHTAFF
jgi:hypothetical protein